MKLKLKNSLTRQIEDFQPLNSKLVTMYSCGPTVYNHAHIGNMRSFLFADLLQRVIHVVGGYDVKWVMNITNIDDKTIRDSALGSPVWLSEMGEQTDNPMKNLEMLTSFYEDRFLEDINKLGIKPVHLFKMPKATDYIIEMQHLVREIFRKGFAYISEGSVYFDVAKWRKTDKYGKLYKIDFVNFRSGVRIDADLYDREQVSDFVIWKAKKDGEPFWEFDIDGKPCPGRPGWHIECSAMEYEILGLPFDIHTGGIDLKFPHHEDEIAQSKAGYGVEPTVMWCHNEFLEVEGSKMSKSKGNFYTLKDLIDKGIDPIDIRFSMFSSHYGSIFNFTFDSIEAARKARLRAQDYIYSLYDDSESGSKKVDIDELKNLVFSEFANDLHTPKALAHLFKFINTNSAKDLDDDSRTEIKEFFRQLNNIFDVWILDKKTSEKIDIPENIAQKALDRFLAKQQKNWELADRLRNEILEAGYMIKDAKDTYTIEKR